MENPKNRKWKVLTSEYLAREPWFTVRHESLELPDGRRIPDYYVLEYPDWINVIAITHDGPKAETIPITTRIYSFEFKVSFIIIYLYFYFLLQSS